MTSQPRTLVHYAGSKTRLADRLLAHFPAHDLFMDLFHGAGGLACNKPLVKYNYFNDINKDIIDLITVLQIPDLCLALKEKIKTCIVSDSFLHYISKVAPVDSDIVQRAFTFLYRANFSLYGKGYTLRTGCTQTASIIYDKIDSFQQFYSGNHRKNEVVVLSKDYKEALSCLAIKDLSAYSRYFIYADPPYVDTDQPYSLHKKWTLIDLETLIIHLLESKYLFAISETDHPQVMALMKRYGLHCYKIARLMHYSKKETNEYLYTNYTISKKQTLLF